MSSIVIRKLPGVFVVRVGGAVIGESGSVLEVSEDALDPVLYFPRDDVATAFLDSSETTTQCPAKGTARYFSIVTKSKTLKDAAWSYESPTDAAARITGHLAFAPSDEVTLEEL